MSDTAKQQYSRFAKPRRPIGSPVSPSPEHAEYVSPSINPEGELTLKLDTILPGISAEIGFYEQIVFYMIGDSGGINGTSAQSAVADAMESQITQAAKGRQPRFLYHLGDVVYYNGQSINYDPQFYEPYQHLDEPIFAIPGNHDGDTHVRYATDQAVTEPSLAGFFHNFCSKADGDVYDFKHRPLMTQPYCYWTLQAPFVYIIGLYSNVDGLLDDKDSTTQQDWFIEQLKNAPKDKWLLVAIHHPLYSLDAVHGGYRDTLTMFDDSVAKAGRIPDAVFHGHVHNYQRFSRKYDKNELPVVVCGNCGYATDAKSLHRLQKGLVTDQLPFETTETAVTLQAYDVSNSGFLRVTASSSSLVIDYFAVPFDVGEEVSSNPADTVKIVAAGQLKSV